MQTDHWQVALEAYLDGELTPREAKAFLTLVSTSPVIAAELKVRRYLRQSWRTALGTHQSHPETNPSTQTFRQALGRPQFWLPAALAACLTLVLGISHLLPNPGHPTIPITVSGQVSVLRYGERPDQTIVLETGSIELPTALDR